MSKRNRTRVIRGAHRAAAAVAAFSVLATSCYSYTSANLQVSFPEQSQTSSIYDRDGLLLTELRASENRTNVRLDQIPEVMRQAIIAIEDERFYIHGGFDLRGLIRSARTNVSAGGIEQGGSTLTQQLVKLTQRDQLTECFDETGVPTRTIQCKIQEINLARRLEQQYNKDFILEQYLNVVFFGNNAYGVQAASEQYFAKDVSQLTLAEAALLAGLVQRPSGFDPYEVPDDAETRRRLVLDRMLTNGFITEAEHDDAYDLSVRTIVRPEREDTSDDATYEARFPGPEFVDEVKRWFLDGDDHEIVELFPTFEDRRQALFGGGLRIYTTLDRSLQERAQEIVYGANGHLPNPEGPDAAAVVMEPGTGHVLAMVAGRDYWSDEVHANLAVAGEDNDHDGDPDGGRQAGSSMKPIALAYALERGGWEVTDALPAPSLHTFLPQEWPGLLTTPWRVKSGGGGANVTLVTGTRQSYNTLYANLMLRIGPEQFVQMAYDLGVDPETSPLSPVPAAVLGTEDVTMLDMATVYATFANGGDRVDPTYVTKIVAADGTVIWEHLPQPVDVLDDQVAAQISWVLRGVIEEGTARASGNIGRPAAGKTGSAQNLADATFIGYVPQLVTAVWVGFPGSQRPMTRATVGRDVFGSTYPTEIWHDIMTYALGPDELNYPPEEFPTPPPSTTSTTTTLLTEAELVPAPDVRGLTEAAATDALIAAGFGVDSEAVDNTEGATPGTVSGQSPLAGELTYLGSVVTIEVVELSTEALTVPNVVGVAVDEARSVLTSAGYTVTEVPDREPGLAPGQNVGLVWAQQPPAGAAAAAGTVVTVRVNPP